MTNQRTGLNVSDVRALERPTLSRAARVVLCAAFLAIVSFVAGCEALENHKCRLFSEDGIFSRKKPEIDRATSKDERDALARATVASSNKKEAWEPTDSEIAAARKNGVDLKNYVWATQRPNGGALFPKEWQAPGPALVVEPASIAAPLGTDIIVVASYIGEDSEYLRVGEQLDWSLSGVGRFMESNPNEFANGQFSGIGERWRDNSCLSCPLVKRSKEVDDRNMSTTTTGKLWRINRGTESRLDDVTILRGQSWASVSAFEEGTSTIVVMAENISNWNKRRAVAEIHWIDAAFRYPDSGVGAVNSTATLTTSVCRRTTAEPRPGWTVRYDVLSGNAGLGSGRLPSTTVQTDANGAASATLTQLGGEPGTCEVLATIIRPATETSKEVVVDKRTIHYTWTSSAPLTLSLNSSSPNANVGEMITYQVSVNNLSDFYQDAILEIVLPRTATDKQFDPPIQEEAPDGSWARWHIVKIPPRKSTTLRFALRKADSGLLDVNARIVQAAPSDPPVNQNAGATTNQLPQAPNVGQPQGGGMNPPVTTTDPADSIPTL